MTRRLALGAAAGVLLLAVASPVSAESVVVSYVKWQPGMESGEVVQVDEQGTMTTIANLFRPTVLKFDKDGNLFVIDLGVDHLPRLFKIPAGGGTPSLFTDQLPTHSDVCEGGGCVSLNDLLVTEGGRVFLLLNFFPPGAQGNNATEIWELIEGGPPILLASLLNHVPSGALARGFTCAPDGSFYLAMMSSPTKGGFIMRVTRLGQVSTAFDPGLPPLNQEGGGSFIDVRFDSLGRALILGSKYPSYPNKRIIWKAEGGSLSTFVSPESISEDGLQLTMAPGDNLFVAGGGYQSNAGAYAFIQRVDALGGVTDLFESPNRYEAIFDIDDDAFDVCPEPPVQVEIDIKPGSFPNSIKLKDKGMIPVAILTTDAFDAHSVDPTTVRFGPTGTEAEPQKSAFWDVDMDGDADLALYFAAQSSELQCGMASATITGRLLSGQSIQGVDSLRIIGCQ